MVSSSKQKEKTSKLATLAFELWKLLVLACSDCVDPSQPHLVANTSFFKVPKPRNSALSSAFPTGSTSMQVVRDHSLSICLTSFHTSPQPRAKHLS